LISGVNLSQSVSEELKLEIRSALWKYKVISFVDQDLNFQQLTEAGKLFGSIYQPGNLSTSEEEYPHIQKAERSKKNQLIIFGGAWHSDNAPQINRPAYTMLYSVKIPKEGGDTLFGNSGIEHFPETFKQMILPKKVTVSWCRNSLYDALNSKGTKGFGGFGFFDKPYNKMLHNLLYSDSKVPFKSLDEKFKSGHYESIQKMVICHPHTGERSLNVNSMYTQKVIDMDAEESEKLLQMLFCIQENQTILRLKWKPNMLTIWDNRLLIHKATPSSTDEERLMYRLMINDPSDENGITYV
jgi:taurine dioxygenase